MCIIFEKAKHISTCKSTFSCERGIILILLKKKIILQKHYLHVYQITDRLLAARIKKLKEKISQNNHIVYKLTYLSVYIDNNRMKI